MKISTGPSLTSVSIRSPQSSSTSSNSYLTNQIMQQIGTKDGVLDTDALKQAGLGPSFAEFDMTSITPAELGLVSKNLYALGLIDKTTANLMISAGTNLDAVGNQATPDVKMNALDYFAARIDNLRSANLESNEYGFQVVPDYINTVYVIQNLNDFAKAQRAESDPQASVKDQASSPGINIRV
ncbi:hypothetical protein [Pseudomonas petrae]|uniref:Uncharacterized protein n=1 Tax=Pseudomonas petrae TaxID=2912190 RepID=A0ABS9I1U8_9PSED|nr:hypothetical protein [Pseudomonas petrae]MCF7535104.1 hypothetical protein [Pseudomonas petrae]MCF7539800.1 hypothetical protein [Pseudomonas petrae]MCF7541304.1 hypothetical protein [Pseudomonas petrae]MCF7558363.1 hypothetical protein [Pseudomonas petrae]